MSDRKKSRGLSSCFLGTEEQEVVPIRYSLMLFLLVGAALLVAGAGRLPWMADHHARLDVNWRFDRADYTYRLRGRYSISSLSDGFATSISNDANPDATSVYVPTGLYRVTLEPGYVLERVAAEEGAAVELVPASLVSPNPVVILAKEGRIAPLGLSLVDMPGTTAAEPEATCMSGS